MIYVWISEKQLAFEDVRKRIIISIVKLELKQIPLPISAFILLGVSRYAKIVKFMNHLLRFRFLCHHGSVKI